MQPVDERGREVSRLLAGRYEVLGLLGRGGFASVYQVRNLRLQRLEALKVVAGTHEESSGFRRRFEQEARVAASLEHPSILKVYDFGHDAGTLWYSMPFVDGPTLKAELARRGTFEEEAAARVLVPLLDALEYSHGRGVIHRDIKPDNILLDRRDRPYLMDFGIAKTDDSLVKTQTGMVLGSPAYISPEQLRGERLDGRTDVYSLGVSLFQMVAGSPPFRSDRMADLADRLVTDAPRLSARKPGVSPALDRIVGRALARSRDERYSGAREMRADLEAFLEGLRAAPAAADPAALEETATLSSVPLPPIEVPAPPPAPVPTSQGPRARRTSAVLAPLPPVPPVPERASEPPAARPGRGRAGVVAAAIGGAFLLFLLSVAAVLTMKRLAERPPAAPAGPAPGAAATPAAAVRPTPAAATPPATAAPSPAPPAATAAPTALPAARPPTPEPRRAPRPTVAPEAAAAAPVERRAVTPPDIDEIAPVALSPEQQRACGGQVVGVSVVVAEDGTLKSKRVISSVSPTCDALALEVLARYRFRPARDRKGRPVEGRFAFTVQF
jgi:serine/threonine-protein kinase